MSHKPRTVVFFLFLLLFWLRLLLLSLLLLLRIYKSENLPKPKKKVKLFTSKVTGEPYPYLCIQRPETIDYKFSRIMNVLLDSLANILETPAGVPISFFFKESKRVPIVPDRSKIAYWIREAFHEI